MIVKKVSNPKKSAGKASRIHGLAGYIIAPHKTNKNEKCIFADGVNFVCDDWKSQTAEMLALSQDSVKSSDTINHYVLSWREFEKPTEEQFRDAVSIFMSELGLDGHQAMFGAHADTNNIHLHLIVNRVHPDTYKVTRVNNGFDIEAAHKAIARIEHAQGWQPETNSRYTVLEDGELGREHMADKSTQPDQVKIDMENRTGTKSAVRVGIEDAAPIIKSATSWADLHARLDAVGMRYERKGSGALIFVGDVPTKASDCDRNASLSKLQKRFGPFEPLTQKEPNVYFVHTPESHVVNAHQTARHDLRVLSKCTLAHSQTQRTARVLQVDVRAHRREPEFMRRESGATSDNGASRLAPEPIKPGVPGWGEYVAARGEHFKSKRIAKAELDAKHEAERVEFAAKQKADRDVMLMQDYRGKGALLNATRSFLKGQQAGARLEIKERHKVERLALREQFQPWPSLEDWQRLRGRPDLADEWRHKHGVQNRIVGDSMESPRLHDLRAFTPQIVGREVHYSRSSEPDSVVFVDRGREINVLDWRNPDVTLAALQLASAKWPKGFQITGNDEYKALCVQIAVRENLTILNSDLQQQIEAERQRVQSEKDALATQQQAAMITRIKDTRKPPATKDIGGGFEIG